MSMASEQPGVAGARGREPPDGLTRDAPLCVGRDAEIERIRAALDAALSGRGRLLLIGGEAGIGKTRLAEVAAAAASASGADVVWGRSWEAGGAPAYWPWIEALRALASERGADALTAAAPAAARQAARLLPALGPVEDLDDDPDAGRFALFDGVAELLLASARERPLVLVLEDLHAADPVSLLLLEFLAPRLAGAPLLVVATHRTGDPDTDPAVERLVSGLSRRGEPLALGGLDLEATRALAAASSDEELSDEAVADLRRRTQGNPFFIESLARTLRSGADAAQPLELPAGVRETIARRLAPFSDETRETLAAAAVVGREFTVPRVARLRGVEPAGVLAILGPPARSGLVAQGGGPGEFRFAHVLIRDWLYADLDAPERAELHRREADALEQETARDPDLLHELAHHRVAAVPAGGADAALDACERAARHALESLAFEEAAALYERALALADRWLEPLGPPRRCELLLALGDARQRAGDSDGAREAFVRAANLARTSELPDELARAALGFGGLVVRPGETDQTLVALLEQALEQLPEDRTSVRARLLARLARELHFGAAERRRELAAEAVEIARRAGDPAAHAFALCAWHVATATPETAAERLDTADAIAQLAREADNLELELEGRLYRAVDLLELGRVGAAAEALEECELLAARLRQPAWTWHVILVKAALALLGGRFEEAERLIGDAYAVGRRARGRGAHRYRVLQEIELRGLTSGVDRLLDDARALSAEAPARWGLAPMTVLAWLGESDEARRALDAVAAADLGGPIDDMAALPIVARIVDACARLGAAEHAPLLYERLLPHADRWVVVIPGAVCLGSVHLHLGRLAALMERLGDADRHLAAAVAAHREAGAVALAAVAEFEHAQVLHRLHRAADASELAGHALRTARALGMANLTSEIEAFSGTGAPARAPASEARLSFEGDYWAADFAGRSVQLRDRKGLRYVATLLEHPHVEHAAVELAGQGAAPAGGDAGAMLDEEAKRSYRRRMDELREEIEEAESWNDPERAERASAELAFLGAELARAVGLGGRDRRAASTAERARVSVTRAIRSAITSVEERHPELGAHLDRSIRTGTHCRYAPVPGDETNWSVRGP